MFVSPKRLAALAVLLYGAGPRRILLMILAAEVGVVGLFFFHAEDGIRDDLVTGVQTCALPIYQAAFAKGLYSPTNRNVVVPPDLAPKLIMGERYVDSIKEAPWSVLLPQRDALLDRWTREFGG